MNKPSLESAQISYTDGGRKTIVFPELHKGDLKKLSIDGKTYTQSHDLRIIAAVVATCVAITVLVIASQMYFRGERIDSLIDSRAHVLNRLYEVAGETWNPETLQWVVDPKWQQDGNKGSGVSNDATD